MRIVRSSEYFDINKFSESSLNWKRDCRYWRDAGAGALELTTTVYHSRLRRLEILLYTLKLYKRA